METLRAILLCLFVFSSSKWPPEAIYYKHVNLYLAENKALHTCLPFEFSGTIKQKGSRLLLIGTGIAVFFVFRNMLKHVYLVHCVYFRNLMG